MRGRGWVARHERRADRLQVHADRLGRRSARALGVVLSLARMAELRQAIGAGAGGDGVRRVGTVGRSADAYAVDFGGIVLIAVYDRRGASIAAFLSPGALEIEAGETG